MSRGPLLATHQAPLGHCRPQLRAAPPKRCGSWGPIVTAESCFWECQLPYIQALAPWLQGHAGRVAGTKGKVLLVCGPTVSDLGTHTPVVVATLSKQALPWG